MTGYCLTAWKTTSWISVIIHCYKLKNFTLLSSIDRVLLQSQRYFYWWNIRTNIRVQGKSLLVLLIDYLCKVCWKKVFSKNKNINHWSRFVFMGIFFDFPKIPFEFHAAIQTKTRKSVVDSFAYVLDKRVISSLIPIFEAIPEESRAALRKSFPEVFGSNEDPAGMVSFSFCAAPFQHDTLQKEWLLYLFLLVILWLIDWLIA